MLKTQAERLVSRILAVGAALTTIFVVSGSVTDPVNAPKLFVLAVFAFAGLFALVFSNLRNVLSQYKWESLAVAVFILASLNSVFFSDAPFSQSFYGTYGRNNGFLTYALLAIILIVSLTLKSGKSFSTLVNALLVAGYVNVIYCIWAIAFGDFIGWSNPYGNILGTLGNPNFIGSFLGIFLSAFVALVFSKESHRYIRWGSLVVIPLTSFEIIKSHAIQGRVVAALGIGIVIFYFIREKFSNAIVWIYVMGASSVGALSLLGALQIGPLTKYIYKTSVSLRGQYWLSGWNTGMSRPFTGVGMDSLGDWYRRSRDAHALVLPGVNTVVNASHNVVMDMFAFGGFPLLVSYLALLSFVFVAIIKVTLRNRKFDPIFVALVTAWIGYQIQSIISINQIGLAIWGWLLGGSLIAYEKSTRPNLSESDKSKNASRKKNGESQNLHLTMVATFGILVGILVGIPPLIADSKWRTAQIEQSLPKTEASMVSGYFNPQTTYKYGVNIQTLESSQLFELSHKYALEAVHWNSENYDLWKMFFLLKNTTPAERELALFNMKRLDPLNPDVTALS